MCKDKYHQILNDAFRNLTLCFGGIFLVYPVKDELIWIMMKSFEDTYLDARKKVEALNQHPLEENAPEENTLTKPHPAIDKFLKHLGTRNINRKA